MTWPCFYCTYENEDDSATQCCICGMPGNRVNRKAALKNPISNGDAENSRASRTASMAIDLTLSPNYSTNSFSSKRKRNNPPASANTNENGDGTSSVSSNNKSSKRSIQRNFNSSLARRKPPQRPKVQQKQSMLSFARLGGLVCDELPSESNHNPHYRKAAVCWHIKT